MTKLVVNYPPKPDADEGLSIEYALKNSLHIHYFGLLEKTEGRCEVCGERPDSEEPLHLHRARPGVDTSCHPLRKEDWLLVCVNCHLKAEQMLYERFGPKLYGCGDLAVGSENAS